MVWSEDKEKVEHENAQYTAMIAAQMGNNDPSIWKYMLNPQEAIEAETGPTLMDVSLATTPEELADLLREMDESGWPDPASFSNATDTNVPVGVEPPPSRG
jgi:hypothetical protein